MNSLLFFLRKLIEALVLPLGFASLLVLIAVFLRRRWLAVVAVLILYTFSIDPVAKMLLRPLESTYPPVAVSAAPRADAIVVLSGGILRGHNRVGIQWDRNSNRFFTAIDLARAAKAGLLVISGGASPSEGPTLRQAAIDAGISPARMIVIGPVFTTADEARAVSRLPAIHSILLVTSAFHMPRAVLLFRARGLDVIPFPTSQFVFRSSHPLNDTEFVPNATPLELSQFAILEYYGLAFYRTLLSLPGHH